jgi:hypothetical protein
MFTVFQINPNTHEKIRALFTGHFAEAEDAINFLVDKKNWPIEHLGMFDCTNGRWTSFNLSR